jgi:hypothetical protein
MVVPSPPQAHDGVTAYRKLRHVGHAPLAAVLGRARRPRPRTQGHCPAVFRCSSGMVGNRELEPSKSVLALQSKSATTLMRRFLVSGPKETATP